MRAKEVATDYRYFPEPDLPPLVVSQEWIDETRNAMPKLPGELYKEFTTAYGLSYYDAQVITENKETAQYYLQILEHTTNYKAAANYLMGAVRGYLNRNAIELSDFALEPLQIAEIIRLIDEGVISNAVGEQTLFPALVENPSRKAQRIG